METNEQSDLPTDCEREVTVADSPEKWKDYSADDEHVCISTDLSDSLESTLLFVNLPSDTIEFDKSESSESSVCTEMLRQDQEEALMLEAGHEVLHRNESIASSVSDTLSSADNLCENKALCERHCTPQLDPQQPQVPEPKQHPEPDQYPAPEHELEPDQYLDPKGDVELGHFTEPEQDTKQDQYPESEQNHELKIYAEQEPNPEDDDYQNLAIDTVENQEVHDIIFEPPITEDSMLEQCIRADVMSNQSSHDLDPDEVDECLTVEVAVASSDSETDEKWRAIFSSSINKEDDDSYLDSLHLSAQELFVQKVEMTDFDEQDNNFEEVCFEVPQEVLEQPEGIISSTSLSQEVKYNHLSIQGLSKLSENVSLNESDANQNHMYNQHTIADPNKKLPKDFCVIQETKSKNVSTEHVDFQLARKQWRELEEQTLTKISLPTAKPSSFPGSHRVMYTPVRNIERSQKKERDLETLNKVGDYPHTQFSPCVGNSGLDDSSYRPPYGDPKTPGEREICLSMEGEENFTRQRDLSRMGKSTDCAPSQSIHRSISTPLTPSFIITSSPTKEPEKHEMLANNVIILDPSFDFNSSPRHGEDNMAAQSVEWHSEDNSNIIILETSNLIIRSASEFSLSKVCEQPQEKMFLNNPFFKLRSRSTISLVDEEIKMVKQREEELKKERVKLYGKDKFNKERILSDHMDTLAFDNSVDVPVKCKSSPSSPMKTANRMDRSALSCDNRFPEVCTGGIRKSTMALRWEAGEFTKSH